MPLLMTLGVLYPCATMTSFVVQEKELRAKELMKVMGVTDWTIGSSWFVSFWCVQIVSATLVTIISGILFQNSRTIYLFYFWQLCFLGFVNLSLFMSTPFSKTTRGVLFLVLFVFVGFFMTAIADFETGNAWVISATSLHPISAMAYALQEVGRLEDAGVGLTASSIRSTDSPSGYTFVDGYLNLVLSNLLLGGLTWYLNRVIRPEYGQALPLWFPFTLEYWFPGRVQRHEDLDSNPSEYDNLTHTTPLEPVSDLLRQQVGDKANIEIKNLRKDFGEKIAVEGLNLSIYAGQVTALLGHNGAGKTTTIGMLTGALPPTEGTATILGKDIRKEMSQIRENVGICLQHDVLFGKLTVREHIVFFSRLKGIYDALPHNLAEASVDQAIRDVALEEKSNTYSQNLSGGMRRKLSLAMAFCGGSKVVILDEPTSGMDPFSRRFIWDIIKNHKRGRCIILTTHFMDEADILGDRIAIMAEGKLRCCGSSLFLKRTYGAGYQLSIELLDNCTKASDDELKAVIEGSVPEATLLSNAGTGMSFQLPLSASDRFGILLEQLDTEAQKGRIKTYGVNMTTLDEVFLLVSRGDDSSRHDYQSSHFNTSDGANPDNGNDDDQRRVRWQMDLENGDLFHTHVRVLLRKRGASFKRDRKAWCCTTILPSLFVFVGLLLVKYAIPKRNFEALPLNLGDFNVGISGGATQNPIPFNFPNSTFTCNPGFCTVDNPTFKLENITNETYFFCGGAALASGSRESCSIRSSERVMRGIDEAGARGVGINVTNITEASLNIFKTMDQFSASEYGGLFFIHEPNSTTASGKVYGNSVKTICFNTTNDYLQPAECNNYGTGFGYTVAYNFTALHSAPLFQVLADEALIRQVQSDFTLSAVIHPLPITRREAGFAQAGDAFILWFLVVLSFPFIPGAFATFVVAERESKAKHLQTVAGVKPSAYWLSTLFWDACNYLIPLTITVVLIFAFDVSVFTTHDRHVFEGVSCLFILFGPAAAGAAYIISFLFKSPSVCNVFIIIGGFIVGMGASVASLLLQFIGRNPLHPRQRLITISKIIQFLGRFFPPFCLGKGLLYVINLDAFDFLNAKLVDAFDREILFWECICLGIESIVYPLLAVWIDELSTNPEAMHIAQRLFCFLKQASEHSVVPTPDDTDVVAERQRVLNGQANTDPIVISGLTKVYPNGKLALDQLSLGIRAGECFGLLGINGAGKTTTMAMLTAEFPPSAGDATLAGFSLRHEPEKMRRRIGYCPQFDAHFANMTGREHVELYAAIKGVPSDSVKAAAAAKLAQVGLSEADSDRLSAKYSGGMKRRLSLACALIGDPQLMLLDECSTGVDPVARREIWQMVSDLVTQDSPGNGKPSVILTTHSMEECEALCPRIGIMANGRLRCLGSSQHLRAKFGRGYQVEAKVATANKEDEDFQSYVFTLARLKGAAEDDVESASADFGAHIHFNLPDSRAALQLLTCDDCLSSMIAQANPIGYGIYKDATSAVGVSLLDLTSFVVNELRIRKLHSFLLRNFPSAKLRERQDMKSRYEISSENNLRIATIFTSIENNKDELKLTDYGISQTSLEQVFNLHAAEAERLKQGIMDG